MYTSCHQPSHPVVIDMDKEKCGEIIRQRKTDNVRKEVEREMGRDRQTEREGKKERERERQRGYFIYWEPSALGMRGLAKERGFTL